ncbi:hypothetical protein Pedsa_0401 [Pseudopedobacter saltans DSM 12145]|uniref:GtrA/DPMS transmembrane domain-containing protein n=1 Tax=Pseudopedobacter saltans (strain ATCC 51119 / DSM 12145 / JCM 21818 / CCUG 39354 / LMG 10337 / NBRC 100064 / NCIMB 13643) TaxID=762903 RepID=F0S566_PSESL|nr:GtrA family protein [Pseudopedobacter saltans]ADY50983.1 hypothetical protein Pedsa_0401 [Pseudopedobacter saltans DSM 12145]
MLKNLHLFIRSVLIAIIDSFYPLFKRFMPLQTFRYAACGGGNQVLNIFIYFISYNFILKKEIIHLPFIAISPHIAAWLIAFMITTPIGFYLSFAVVFNGSYLKKRIQLFRYFAVVMICILLNYMFMKLFVEHLHWYPTISFIITNVLVTAFSYLSQRNFSFRQKKP